MEGKIIFIRAAIEPRKGSCIRTLTYGYNADPREDYRNVTVEVVKYLNLVVKGEWSRLVLYQNGIVFGNAPSWEFEFTTQAEFDPYDLEQ